MPLPSPPVRLRAAWLARILCASLLLMPAMTAIAAGEAGRIVPLFNGRNLEGWVIENNAQFSVRDGLLRLERGTGWLRSVDTFSDFVLTVEVRFLEPSANSGIFVRTGPTSHRDETGWPDNGYQIQCMDIVDSPHPLGSLIPYGAPEFVHSFDRDAIRRAIRVQGEWNTIEIACTGEEMAVRLNGVPVATARSIRNSSGHIGIQGERGLLEFRRIEVRAI